MDDHHQQRYERLRLKVLLLRSAVRGLDLIEAEKDALATLCDEGLIEIIDGLAAVGDPRVTSPDEQELEVH